MAQKTRAEILSEINTLLADNTTGAISAEDVRNVFIDVKDSFYNLEDNDLDDIKGYNEALLYITQSGTDGPEISTTFKNDFTNLAFSYIDVGIYSVSADEGLTTAFFQYHDANTREGQLVLVNVINSGITCRFTDSSIGNLRPTDGKLQGYLYIRKYV